MPLLRMWVHCPRASNGLLPRRSNLVGYVRWDAQSDRFPPCQTIISTALQVAIRVARDPPGTGDKLQTHDSYFPHDLPVVFPKEVCHPSCWKPKCDGVMKQK